MRRQSAVGGVLQIKGLHQKVGLGRDETQPVPRNLPGRQKEEKKEKKKDRKSEP